MSEIKIFINDKACAIAGPDQKVADLLGEVGVTVEDAVLVTPDGIEHDKPEETVHVSDGDRLETRPPTDIHYQVNGESQTTTSCRLTVGVILEDAGKSAGIDVSGLANYYLENVATEQRYDDLDAEVVVCEGDSFIAVHRGPTPVA